jgi:hypothetical protein
MEEEVTMQNKLFQNDGKVVQSNLVRFGRLPGRLGTHREATLDVVARMVKEDNDV